MFFQLRECRSLTIRYLQFNENGAITKRSILASIRIQNIIKNIFENFLNNLKITQNISTKLCK